MVGINVRSFLKTCVSTFLLLLVAVVFYSISGCPFRFVLGLPCPGCGMTRAWAALFEGRVVDAFHWHPLFWLAVPLLALLIINNGRLLRVRAANNALIIGISALCLGVYIARMIKCFPNAEPMAFNTDALFIKVLFKGS